jgi:hypothetical protein
MAEDSSEIVREQSESVAATNLKTLGDGPAFYQNMGFANAVANQQAMNQLQMTLLGKIAEAIVHTSPSEGGADTAGLGMLIKAMQTVPPVTSPTPVVHTGGPIENQ